MPSKRRSRKKRLTEPGMEAMGKAPAGKRIEVTDTVQPGLTFRVTDKGAKSWCLYFYDEDGKHRRYTIGRYPDIGLVEARELAKESKKAVREGHGPDWYVEERQREAKRQKANTFRAVAELYMAEHNTRRLRSHVELQRKLDKDILPKIGDRPISSLTRPDIKELIEAKRAESPIAANRVLSLVRTVLYYAVDEELIDANPAARIKPVDEVPRARVLEEHEIRSFWHGLDEATIEPQLRHALKLILVLGRRRGEVIGASWDEFDFARERWTIPSERLKATNPRKPKPPLLVPLPPLALELLDEVAEFTAHKGSDYVFANGGGQPFSPYSVSQGMRKSLKAMNLADKPAVPHDLRRTCSTRMAEIGISRLVVEKILHHEEATVTGKHYELYDYEQEKRFALTAWANRLSEIVSGKAAPSNVVKLPEAVNA